MEWSLSLYFIAMVAKLGSSIDDVIWFTPFIEGERKKLNCFLYLAVLEAIVLFSWVIAIGATKGFSMVSVGEKTIQIAAGILIAGYAFYLWYNRKKASEEKNGRGVVIVSLLGSLDELSYFPALILGGIFTVTQLGVGTALAAVVVIVSALSLNRIRLVKELLAKIPLWGILGFFAAVVLLKTVVGI